jgi:hypothetical protein
MPERLFFKTNCIPPSFEVALSEIFREITDLGHKVAI